MFRSVVATAVGVLLSSAAFAEVADKIPSPSQLWIEGAVLAALGFLLSRWRTWLSLVPVAAAAVLCFGVVSEYLDPAVGDAIRRELGSRYALHIAAAYSLPILAWIVITLHARTRARMARRDDA